MKYPPTATRTTMLIGRFTRGSFLQDCCRHPARGRGPRRRTSPDRTSPFVGGILLTTTNRSVLPPNQSLLLASPAALLTAVLRFCQLSDDRCFLLRFAAQLRRTLTPHLPSINLRKSRVPRNHGGLRSHGFIETRAGTPCPLGLFSRERASDKALTYPSTIATVPRPDHISD